MIRLYSRSCTDTFKEATLRTNVDNVYACPFFAARRFSSIFSHITESLVYNISIYIDMVPPSLWQPAGTSHSRSVVESVMYAFYLATHFQRNIYFAFLLHFCFSFRYLGTVDTFFTIIFNRPMICNPMIYLQYRLSTGLYFCYKILLSEYGQKPLTSSDESDDFLWF